MRYNTQELDALKTLAQGSGPLAETARQELDNALPAGLAFGTHKGNVRLIFAGTAKGGAGYTLAPFNHQASTEEIESFARELTRCYKAKPATERLVAFLSGSLEEAREGGLTQATFNSDALAGEWGDEDTTLEDLICKAARENRK